ncbi:hypothetical protein ACIBBG_25760 [Micromonospora chersina]|uniref:hypothetical protein n=1 Tax=Micromonospora chersina TaxID=47854 RepID=UPI003792B56A
MQYMTLRTAQDVIDALIAWIDQDEPLVEAIEDTLAQYSRTDSQEQARRVVATVIDVLQQHVGGSE